MVVTQHTAQFAGVEVPWIGALLWWLFVLAVPIFLIGANVRAVTLSPATYSDGFEKYEAGRKTGLDEAQLRQVARAFIDFFQGSSRQLEVEVIRGGRSEPLFNEREIQHMADVHTLMRVVFTGTQLAAAYLILFVVVGSVLRRSAVLGSIAQGLLAGSALTLGLLVLVGLLSLLDFTTLFVRFHQLSFRNDLWMLNPSRDALLMLFPEGFWLDVTIRLAGMIAIEAAIIAAVGLGMWRLAPHPGID